MHLVHFLIVTMVGPGMQKIKRGLVLCWNAKRGQDEMGEGLSVNFECSGFHSTVLYELREQWSI